MNPLYDDDGDENISDKLLPLESCARTAVYAPKRARYFILGLTLCFILVPDLSSLWHGHYLDGNEIEGLMLHSNYFDFVVTVVKIHKLFIYYGNYSEVTVKNV